MQEEAFQASVLFELVREGADLVAMKPEYLQVGELASTYVSRVLHIERKS